MKLGEMSFGLSRLGELGKTSFGIMKLGELGEMSLGIPQLGELSTYFDLDIFDICMHFF